MSALLARSGRTRYPVRYASFGAFVRALRVAYRRVRPRELHKEHSIVVFSRAYHRQQTNLFEQRNSARELPGIDQTICSEKSRTIVRHARVVVGKRLRESELRATPNGDYQHQSSDARCLDHGNRLSHVSKFTARAKRRHDADHGSYRA